MSFPSWGAAPIEKGNKQDATLVPISKFDGLTTYHNDFQGSPNAKKVDSNARKEYRDKQRKGNLTSSSKLPFNGNSTSKATFTYDKEKVNKVERIIPRDEVSNLLFNGLVVRGA